MDLSDPGIKAGSLALQADSLLTELPRKPSNTMVPVNWASFFQPILLPASSEVTLSCILCLFLVHQIPPPEFLALPKSDDFQLQGNPERTLGSRRKQKIDLLFN